MSSASHNQIKYANELTDKKVLVLGGTSGIGYCVAEAALEFGAFVIIASSTSEKVESAQKRLKEAYPNSADRVSGTTCDLSNPETLEANLRALLEFTGKKIHHIVHTVGDNIKVTPVRDVTPEILQKLSIVRFTSFFILAKLAPEYIVDGPESSITTTGGVNSSRPAPDWTVNASFGSGKEGMVRGLAVDLKPVRVNLVSPGAVVTELWGSFAADKREGMLEKYKKATLTGRLGRPEEVAEAYLYCMRDEFLTGTVISTEGGRLLV